MAAGAHTHHRRDQDGRHEVDFVIERAGAVLAEEVKLAPTVNDADVRHLQWLGERLGADLVDALVVTTGPEAYRRRDGTGVVPLGVLAP